MVEIIFEKVSRDLDEKEFNISFFCDELSLKLLNLERSIDLLECLPIFISSIKIDNTNYIYYSL